MKLSYPKHPLEIASFVFITLLMGFGLYYAFTDLKYFEAGYTREDGLIEWLTFIALGLGCGVNFYRAQILGPFRERRFVSSLYLLAFVFLFGLLEEISYGQRIWQAWFDFQVPEFFVKYNSQGEMNLHNLRLGGTNINRLVFGLFLGIGVVIYFLILPLAYNKLERIQKLIDSFALPIPRWYHILAYIIWAAVCEIIPGGKKGEMLELGGCWISMLMVFNPINRKIFSRQSLTR